MAKNSKRFTKLALGALALGTAFTAANDALALDRGCQNADVVRQGLKDEGQFVVVSAVRPIPSQPKNIFTTNADGSVGYKIEQGTGNTTGQLCVGIKYTDIRVNSNADMSTPSWALLGSKTPHDQWLHNVEQRTNEKVLMGATVLRDVNGQDVRGGFMMVTRGDVSKETTTMSNAGVVSLSFSDGRIDPALLIANVEKVQPNYDAFANRGTQVASLDRK